MPVTIHFSLEGSEVVSRRLGISAEGVSSFREPLEQIGHHFMKTFDQNFDSRGRTYGGWAPRKPKYKRGVRVDTWPLMEKTGRLRGNFQQHADDFVLLLDNPTPYFVYHQSNQPRTRLPRRVMMKIRDQDARTIVREFQYYLVRVVRRGERL